MTWESLAEEVASLFHAMPDTSFRGGLSRLCFFERDTHHAADTFISATPEERERIRTEEAERAKQRRASALSAPRIIKPSRVRVPYTYNDPAIGRNLERRSGKVDEIMRARIVDLAERLSHRKIALRLNLSRQSVARALGKDWGRDKRVGRKR